MRLLPLTLSLTVLITTGCATTFQNSPASVSESDLLDQKTKTNQRELSFAKFNAPIGIAAFEDHQRNQHALTKTRNKVFVVVSTAKPSSKTAAALVPKEAVPVPRIEKPMPVSIPAQVKPSVQYPVVIHFDFDRAELQASESDKLVKLIQALSQDDDVVIVTGHTDSNGEEKYNATLGRKRAESVKSFLLGKGISTARVSVDSKGEREPIASNVTDPGRAQNRRVEITRQ